MVGAIAWECSGEWDHGEQLCGINSDWMTHPETHRKALTDCVSSGWSPTWMWIIDKDKDIRPGGIGKAFLCFFFFFFYNYMSQSWGERTSCLLLEQNWEQFFVVIRCSIMVNERIKIYFCVNLVPRSAKLCLCNCIAKPETTVILNIVFIFFQTWNNDSTWQTKLWLRIVSMKSKCFHVFSLLSLYSHF